MFGGGNTTFQFGQQQQPQQPAQGGLFGQQPAQTGASHFGRVFSADPSLTRVSWSCNQVSVLPRKPTRSERRQRHLASPRSSSRAHSVPAAVSRTHFPDYRKLSIVSFSAAAFGGFGTQNRPAFGAAPAPATGGLFGTQAQNAAPSTGFGGFGAATNSTFSASTRFKSMSRLILVKFSHNSTIRRSLWSEASRIRDFWRIWSGHDDSGLWSSRDRDCFWSASNDGLWDWCCSSIRSCWWCQPNQQYPKLGNGEPGLPALL